MEHTRPSEGRIAATYDYTDENNKLLFQIVRFDPKDFSDRRPNEQGGWIWGLGTVQRVLYRLPEVIKASAVLILEGEKDVETAYRLGLPDGFAATSSPFGAGQWLSKHSESLRGKRVFICPDNDMAGKQHMKQINRDLSGKASEIRIINLPESVKDLTEWEQSGGTSEEFAALIHKADQYRQCI